MSDSYQSVMFPSLERSQVAEMRDRVLVALVDGGLIEDVPVDGKDCGDHAGDYTGTYLPARGLNRFISADLRALNRIAMDGPSAAGQVGTREGFGINPLALNLLADCADATCPNCYALIEAQDIDELVTTAANGFWTAGIIPRAECPRCHASADIRSWQFNYPLGFTYLAFEFWNWPEFNSSKIKNWTIDIPPLMSRAAGGVRIELGGGRL